ncbi:MOSC domain-containing protein [Saccharopolyspora gloriosae]|uniref:MOSC domain-containing protein n=1 Tax=Saccharopolyspora gloriosae TaxID=455344 RepID=UPI001FB5F5FD|nr:MOSC N-terminal beta barrel domain-containing protein [Saccharopolyspora gloriosae]
MQGTIAELYRWPVKSLRGESVTAARFDERGMVGDRAHVLIDERTKRAGSVLTVRQNPTLLHWAGDYGGDISEPAGEPTLHGPDGSAWKWDDPELPGALADSLGIPLSLRSEAGNQDRGPTVLVTLQATVDALSADMGERVDLLRFRPNLHLNLDVAPFAELDWEPGTTITTGDLTLEIVGANSGACVRCVVPSWNTGGTTRWKELQSRLIDRYDNKFGTIMRATRSGTARRGEAAVVRPAGS